MAHIADGIDMDRAYLYEKMSRNSMADIASMLDHAAALVAATHDRGLEAYTPTQVEREISELFDGLKDRLEKGGFLDSFKKDDGRIGWLI